MHLGCLTVKPWFIDNLINSQSHWVLGSKAFFADKTKRIIKSFAKSNWISEWHILNTMQLYISTG